MDTRPPPGFVIQGSETPPPPPGFVMKDTPDLPPAELGAGGRFMAGVEDPLVGGSQLLTHTFGSEESAQKADEAVREREKRLQAGGMQSGDLMRAGGRMVSSIPAMAVAGPIGGVSGVLGAAAGGALSEAVQPVTDQDYWTTKGTDALLGAAFGAAGGATAKAAGFVPKEPQKALMQAGVTLTPGQIVGGFPRRTEEALKSMPILGGFIRGAEGRSIESFNKATIDQALEPIGVKVPSSVKAGHEANSFAAGTLDNAYETLLPKMQLTMDQRLASDIANTRFQASSLPDAQVKQFDIILRNQLERRFRDTGTIPGQELKAAESEINRLATSYSGSSVAGERELGRVLQDIRAGIRDALERQNPAQAAELQKINKSYAMFARIREAGSKATKEGVFTPADLLSAIRRKDKSVGHGQFFQGDALMQDWAEYAQKVLPSKMPDSGTTERALFAGGALSAGAWFHNPMIPIGLGAAATPYTKVGQAVVNKASQPGPVREAVSPVFKKSAPYIGTAIEPYLKTLTE